MWVRPSEEEVRWRSGMIWTRECRTSSHRSLLRARRHPNFLFLKLLWWWIQRSPRPATLSTLTSDPARPPSYQNQVSSPLNLRQVFFRWVRLFEVCCSANALRLKSHGPPQSHFLFLSLLYNSLAIGAFLTCRSPPSVFTKSCSP